MAKKTKKQFPLAGEEFRFTLDLPIAASRAWKAMTEEVHAWWPTDYLAAGPGSKMRFDLQLGGGLIEEAKGGNGVVWYRIITLDAPRSVTMTGFIAPPFGGPATTTLRLTITESSKKASVLEIHNTQFGHIIDCDVEAGWKTIFGKLASYLGRKAL